MTTELRFDQVVLKQAEAFVQEVAKQKEVRSVAVIIDWDLPNQDGLPTGLWYHSPTQDPLASSISMSAQLGRAVTNQQFTTLQIINKAIAEQTKLKGAANASEPAPANS